jgi:hypothetical protein
MSSRRMQVSVAVMIAPVVSLKHSSSEPLVLLADIGFDTVRARAHCGVAPPGWSHLCPGQGRQEQIVCAHVPRVPC